MQYKCNVLLLFKTHSSLFSLQCELLRPVQRGRRPTSSSLFPLRLSSLKLEDSKLSTVSSALQPSDVMPQSFSLRSQKKIKKISSFPFSSNQILHFTLCHGIINNCLQWTFQTLYTNTPTVHYSILAKIMHYTFLDIEQPCQIMMHGYYNQQ